MSETQSADIGGESDRNCEPGSCQESMLITTDSIEEFSQEISISLAEDDSDQNGTTITVQDVEKKAGEIEGTTVGTAGGNITKIQDGLIVADKDSEGAVSKSSSFSSAKSRDMSASCTSLGDDGSALEDAEDYLHDPKFLLKKKHVFILSSAGKPIYTMHGNEHKLATLFGVMQALVSFVQSNNDSIKSIHAMGVKFVFLVKSPLILVAISRTSHSVQQVQLQLT